MLSFVGGKRMEGFGGEIIDALALWALVAGMAAFAFVAGPTTFILSGAIDGLGNYFQTFFEKSLYTGVLADDIAYSFNFD